MSESWVIVAGKILTRYLDKILNKNHTTTSLTRIMSKS